MLGDPNKVNLNADGYDVAHLVVQLHDAKGRAVKTENTSITFQVQGDARWLGVDNGAADNIQDFQSKSITTAKGRTLAIIQSNRTANQVKVTATAKGFTPQTLLLTIE